MKTIIIILVIIFIVLLAKKKQKHTKDVIEPTTSLYAKENHLNAKEQRNNTHQRVWIVLRYMVTYNNLMESSNFYDLKKNMEDYNKAKDMMTKGGIQNPDIETAIRFCRMENLNGTCQHYLSIQEISQIKQWQNIEINEEELLDNTLTSYKFYWAEVLNSYKRPSARKNRLVYLVDDLNKVIELPLVQKHQCIIYKIQELQEYYSKLININNEA